MDINQLITQYEVTIRLSCFLGIFFVMALWEVLAPKKTLTANKTTRWLNNIALVVLNTVLLRLLFPAAAVGLAIFTHQQGWGIFNYYQLPPYLSIFIVVVLMDMSIYFQHVMVHAVPLLWRLHRVHHVDPDIDVTTGARFHPLEIILSMVIKFSVIIILGAPVIAVILFEVILNALAMFNHANVNLPVTVDKFLRLLVVTPDMHRVHHSVEIDETNSNFGFNLPWWDKIFGTYKAQPKAGHENMLIGVLQFKQAKQITSLWGMLLLPFASNKTSYAINRNNK